MTQIKLEQKTVTPDLAAAMLGKSKTRNRTENVHHIRNIAADMKAGRFVLNGQPIVLDRRGNVQDGHHRLRACVLAGVPFDTVIVSGVDPDTRPTQGTGMPWSPKHALQVRFPDAKNLTAVSAVCRWVWLAESGHMGLIQSGARMIGFSNTDLVDTLANNPGIADCVSEGCRWEKEFPLCRRTMFGFALFYFSKYDPDAARRFCERLASGANLNSTDPVFLLRKRITELSSGRDKPHPRTVLAYVIKAWNATKNGTRIRCLRWADNEEYPTPDISRDKSR